MQFERQNATSSFSKISSERNSFKFNKNQLETINDFFKKNNTFIKALFNKNSDKKKFIEEIETRLNKKRFKLFDVNRGRKGDIVKIEINDTDENKINYYYNDDPSKNYTISIDDFIRNIYYNQKNNEMFLSFKNIETHLPEYSKIDNINIINRNIINFFEEIKFSSLDETDKLYISNEINKGNELNQIIDNIKKISIDRDKYKKINKYQQNFNYLTSNNKLSIKIDILSDGKYTAKPVFSTPINKQYYISAGNIKIKNISKNNDNKYEYDTEIILTKQEEKTIEDYMNKKYDIIKEELLIKKDEKDEKDKIRMPPPSKRQRLSGGKSVKKIKRKIYKDDKGKLYIKYNKNTIIYLTI